MRLVSRRVRESSARGYFALPIQERNCCMKKILAIAALAALSACSKPAPAPEADTTTAAEPAPSAAENIAADGKSSIGKFKVIAHDGKVYMEEDKADGTYVGTQDGKVVETGKWRQADPGTFCFTKDAKDATEQCNAEKVENGVWTTKNAKGEVSTVERIEG
jgi:hypothetical protein